jgi:soluble lytic murein transglycosylase-like protein
MLLLSGCGAAATQTLASARTDEPLHDPCAEWAKDQPALPAREAAPSMQPRRVRLELNEPEPAYEVGPFSAGQLARISRVQPVVHAAATTHDVPVDLVNGIIWVESQFQVEARSPAGAHGLMQLMPRTGREVARELGRHYLPFDPEFNIHAGTYYFAQLLRRFDWNLRLALAAYNSGPATVESWLYQGAPIPECSRTYVNRVLIAARAFRRVATSSADQSL